VKAWRRHRSAVMNYAVPVGEIVLAIYDDRADSPACGLVMEIPTGRSNYSLITIPAGVWTGFMGAGPEPAVVANCSTEPHDATACFTWPRMERRSRSAMSRGCARSTWAAWKICGRPSMGFAAV